MNVFHISFSWKIDEFRLFFGQLTPLENHKFNAGSIYPDVLMWLFVTQNNEWTNERREEALET